MSNIEKILEKMRRNPRDWRIEQIAIVAEKYRVMIRKTSGSHVVFSHPNWVELLTIPAHRPIKPIYIKKFIKLIELLEDL